MSRRRVRSRRKQTGDLKLALICIAGSVIIGVGVYAVSLRIDSPIEIKADTQRVAVEQSYEVGGGSEDEEDGAGRAIRSAGAQSERGSADEESKSKEKAVETGLAELVSVTSKGIHIPGGDTADENEIKARIESYGLPTQDEEKEEKWEKPESTAPKPGEFLPPSDNTFDVEREASGAASEIAVPKPVLPSFDVATGEQKKLNIWDIRGYFKTNSVVGYLTSDALGIKKEPVKYGMQPQINSGLCQYALMDEPGTIGRTTLMAHNYNPKFKLGKLSIGDIVQYDTQYGEFTYEVYNTFVMNEPRDDYWLRESYYEAQDGDLVMQTCYPLDYYKPTDQRYVVYCRQLSGPTVEGIKGDSLRRFSDWEEYKSWKKLA